MSDCETCGADPGQYTDMCPECRIREYDDAIQKSAEREAQLVAALDHSSLRLLFGLIEDSGTIESATLWSVCQTWFEIRDKALATPDVGE